MRTHKSTPTQYLHVPPLYLQTSYDIARTSFLLCRCACFYLSYVFSQSHWHSCSLIFPVVVGQPFLQPPVEMLDEPKIQSRCFPLTHVFPSPHCSVPSLCRSWSPFFSLRCESVPTLWSQIVVEVSNLLIFTDACLIFQKEFFLL